MTKCLNDEIYGASDLIEMALQYCDGTHTLDDIARGIYNGQFTLWTPGGGSVIVTEVVVYPRRKVLNIFLGAGDMDDLINTLPALEDHARANGCDGLACSGRIGWARVLKEHGWGNSHMSVSKDLRPTEQEPGPVAPPHGVAKYWDDTIRKWRTI